MLRRTDIPTQNGKGTEMKTGGKPSERITRLALTSAVAGATLLGCATPALADTPSPEQADAGQNMTKSGQNSQELAKAQERVRLADAAVKKAQKTLDDALATQSKADAAKTKAEQTKADKQAAYDAALNTPAVAQAKAQVQAAKTSQAAAKTALDQAQREVDRLEAQEGASNPTIVALTRDRDQARTALANAQATTAQKQADATRANQLRTQGTAGYFKYKGATGAYKILTDPNYSPTVFSSIHLNGAEDATNLDNMIASKQYLEKCNQLRVSEGLPVLQVSDTMMAMAQADTDWSSANLAHANVFNVDENLAWGPSGAFDPFYAWYTQEKQNKVSHNGGETGHYENIVRPTSRNTGFALTQYHPTPNANYLFYGQTFTEAHATRSFTRAATEGQLWAGNQNMTVADFFQSIDDYRSFLNNAQTALTTAQAAETAARNDLNTKQTALDTALAGLSPSAALVAARAARDQARTALANAGTALTNAQSALASAQAAAASDPAVLAAHQALETASAALTTATQAATRAATDVVTARTTLTNAQSEQTAAKQDLAKVIANGGLNPNPGSQESKKKPQGPVAQGDPDNSLAATGSDSLVAATAAAALCAVAMGAFGIRRRLQA